MSAETEPSGPNAAVPSDASPAVSLAAGHCIAWVAAAVVNAAYIATLKMPPGGLKVRLAHHFYDAGQLLAVGLLSWAVILGWGGARRKWAKLQSKRSSLVALTLLSIAVGYFALRPSFRGLAERIGFAMGYAEDAEPEPQQTLLYLALSLSVPAAYFVGARMARRGWRWGAVGTALAALVMHERVIDGAYPGVHCYVSWSAATLAGTALSGTSLASVPSGLRLLAKRLRYVGFAAAVGVAGWSVLVWPSNAVLVALFQVDGAVVMPNLADLRNFIRRTAAGSGGSRVAGEWVPASGANLLPENPIVILITIDSIRADVVSNKVHRKGFPNFVQLQKESVDFALARTSSSGTRYSLSGLFAGRYWSQLPWTNPESYRPVIKSDPSPRFTDILHDAEVQTVTFVSEYRSLINANGIVRSFEEETILKPEKRGKFDFVTSVELLDHAIPRLLEQGERPMFMYMHWMDPHAPYDVGGKKGSNKRRYINEIVFVDKQLGRLRKSLEKAGLWDRTVLIISADHGEGLGEHNCKYHNRNLYEELIRVPLVFRIPGVVPRKVEAPVSQLDVGPTILDLMGLDTPPEFIGESLVPYLRGETPTHTRPIAAEHKQMIAWITDDNFKVIINEKKQTEEIYDLTEDPKELDNLRDDLERGDEMIDALRAYFHSLSPDSW